MHASHPTFSMLSSRQRLGHSAWLPYQQSIVIIIIIIIMTHWDIGLMPDLLHFENMYKPRRVRARGRTVMPYFLLSFLPRKLCLHKWLTHSCPDKRPTWYYYCYYYYYYYYHYYFYFFSRPWYFIPKALEINGKELSLGASRLVKKWCRQIPEWVAETNWIEALNRNGKTLKREGRFSRVIWDTSKTTAQRREEVTTSLVYGTESIECKCEKR